MAFDDIKAELGILMTRMQNEPQDRHELYLQLMEKLNELRAYGMPLPQDLVTLEKALEDKAYRLPDTYVGPAGISWLHRWARDKGREFIVQDEPKVPEFVLKISGFESE